MRVLLPFIAGIAFAISALVADIELDDCAQWIGRAVQICKQEDNK
jgi:hypothetical protein